MSNLSFNKNKFIKNNPVTLSKPLPQNFNGFGRRKVEDIKEDMYLARKQANNQEKLNGLKHLISFKNWSNK